MKIFKYCFLFFILCLILTIESAIAARYSSTGIVGIFYEIKARKTVDTGEEWTKKQGSVQSYNFQKAWTTLTDPCNNCHFKVNLYMGTVLYGYTDGYIGDNIYLDNKLLNQSAQLGNYKIKINRIDNTLLTTWHVGDWYIDKTNPNAVYK